jgi:hypothetical protein
MPPDRGVPPLAGSGYATRRAVAAVELPARQLDSWQVAEENAAAWMRYWGHSDAACTAAGADGGIDVRARTAVAQVKFEAAQVGAPAVQRLVGARGRDHSFTLYFFSGAGFARPAVDYAEMMGIALFKYDLLGRMTPVSSAANAAIARAPESVRLSEEPLQALPAVRAWLATTPPAQTDRSGWFGRKRRAREVEAASAEPSSGETGPMPASVLAAVLGSPGVAGALRAGNRIQAIKHYRTANPGFGLRESKRLIDAVSADSRVRR